MLTSKRRFNVICAPQKVDSWNNKNCLLFEGNIQALNTADAEGREENKISFFEMDFEWPKEEA